MKRKGKKFSESEYNSLRNEMIERISIINKLSSTAIGTILTTWGAGIALVVFFEKSNISLWQSVVAISLMETFVFLIPIFYFIPIAVKSGENFVQVVSLSTYIRVFYDCNSLINNFDLYNWETSNNLVSQINVNRSKKSRMMRLYNEEFTIMSICSFIIYVICAFLGWTKIKKVLDNDCYLFLVILFYIALGIVGIISIIIIHKNSCIKNNMMEKNQYLVNCYVKRALELNIISKKQAIKFLEELKVDRSIEDYYYLIMKRGL